MSKELEQLTKDLTFGNYTVTEQGIYKTTKKGDILICPMPVVPTAIYENLDTKIEKVELTFRKHGKWKSIIKERADLATTNKIVNLANDGIEITSLTAKDMIAYLSETISSSMSALPYKDSKGVLGWQDGDFIPYLSSIAFDGEDQFRSLYKDIEHKGNMLEYIRYIAELRQNMPLRLVMAASFASPLIELIGENPFCLHVWGGTGTCKTVSLLVAMSIWGNPAPGHLVRTMNMTANAMMSTAAFLKNLPFAGDELQTIKSRWGNYDNLIMQVTEGIERARMSYDKVNETKSWKCSFIFSGEEPCIKTASGGGAKNRVIEIHVLDKIVAEGNKTANFVKTNYGLLAENYLKAVKDEQYLNELYNGYFQAIMADPKGTTDKQAGSMAIMMLADEIARRLFWPSEKTLQIEDVIDYLQSAEDVDVAKRAWKFTCGFIAENGVSFKPNAIKEIGLISDDDPQTVYFLKTALTRVLSDEGYDFEACKAKWTAQGYLIPKSRGNLRWQKKIGGNPSASCIRLNLPMFADADEEPPEGWT